MKAINKDMKRIEFHRQNALVRKTIEDTSKQQSGYVHNKTNEITSLFITVKHLSLSTGKHSMHVHAHLKVQHYCYHI